jgi:ubiquitin-like 1-activating enzyme E1 B
VAPSLASLSARAAKSPEDPLSFDKDDDDALNFVTAVANLRARVYGIDTRTRFQVKQMAGNIIPAIASTNAIIAGALVLQALHALEGDWKQARLVNKTAMPRFLVGSQTCAPNPACGVCADVYVALQADATRLTLGQLLQDVARASREDGGLGMETEDVEVYEGSRLLADSDFDDNHEKTLAELNIGIGNFVALVDEGGEKSTIQFVIERLSPASSSAGDEKAWALPPVEKLPALSDKVEIPAPAPDSDDDDDEVAVVDAPSAPKTAGASEKASRKRSAADDADAPDSTADAAAGESDVKRARIQQTGADASSAIEL